MEQFQESQLIASFHDRSSGLRRVSALSHPVGR